MQIVKTCGACGREYTVDTWRALGNRQRTEPVNDGQKPDIQESRDCTCKSTLYVWLDDDGEISKQQNFGLKTGKKKQ
jgi:hypothetical protein